MAENSKPEKAKVEEVKQKVDTKKASSKVKTKKDEVKAEAKKVNPSVATKKSEPKVETKKDEPTVEELLKKVDALTKAVENNKNSGDDPTKFNFEEYRIKVVNEDIKKVEEFNSSYKWFWFIPIIGVYKFGYDWNQVISGLDRGVVRQEINRSAFKGINILIFIFMILFGWLSISGFNLFPLIQRKFNKTALKNSKARLEKKDI